MVCIFFEAFKPVHTRFAVPFNTGPYTSLDFEIYVCFTRWRGSAAIKNRLYIFLRTKLATAGIETSLLSMLFIAMSCKLAAIRRRIEIAVDLHLCPLHLTLSSSLSL